MTRMDVKRRVALSYGLVLGCSALFIGLVGAQSAEGESDIYASDIEALTEDLREDVSTSKIVLERMNRASKAASETISDEVEKNLRSQYGRLEEDITTIEEGINRFIELAEDPTANREEMRISVYDLFMQIQKFSEDNDDMRDLIDGELLPYADQEAVMWVSEFNNMLDWVQGAAFEHISELGEKLQNPIVWEYRCLGPLNPKRLDNGNTLLVEIVANRVIEVTPSKEIVWEDGDLLNLESPASPTMVARLESVDVSRGGQHHRRK